MRDMGIDDPVQPHLQDSTKCVRSKVVYPGAGTELEALLTAKRFVFTLTHGAVPIHNHIYRQICIKLYEIIETEVTNWMLIPRLHLDLKFFEVRLAVISPDGETEKQYGNSPVIYCFCDRKELTSEPLRKRVWQFLQTLQHNVHGRLVEWSRDQPDKSKDRRGRTIEDIVLADLNNMACFVIYNRDGGFIGGWSIPMRRGDYYAREHGKPEEDEDEVPAAYGQTWDDYLLSPAISLW